MPGIPVVTVDRRAEGVTGLLAHVGAENVLGGEARRAALLGSSRTAMCLRTWRARPVRRPAIDNGQGLHNIIDPRATSRFRASRRATSTRPAALRDRLPGASLRILMPSSRLTTDMALETAEAAAAVRLACPSSATAYARALQAIQAGDLYVVGAVPGEQVRTSLRTIVDFITSSDA
ncbi:MAG: hypothetical protein R2851_16725 [Caldilineaceae bacterium]